MFFSDQILSKRGPLAKVWLAAHLERKLTKAALLQTSIPKSVEAIMGQELVPMALRLSGQLLLGVARIYSRKAKYLMDDCAETLSKVKMAFRPGAVDMTEEQATVAKSAITRTETANEFDMLYNDMNYNYMDLDELLATPMKTTTKKSITADDADITLPDHNLDMDLSHNDYNNFDLDLDFGGAGIDSQQFGGSSFQLDLDLGDDLAIPSPSRARRKRAQSAASGLDEDPSVELGRDAALSSARKSAGGRLSSHDPFAMEEDEPLDKTLDQGYNTNMDIDDFQAEPDAAVMNDLTFDDFGGPGLDLGLDFDNPLPPKEQSTPRATTPAASVTEGQNQEPDITPRTAKRVADAADANEDQENIDIAPAKKRQVKKQKQIVDAVTELDAQSPNKKKSTSGAAQYSQGTLVTRSGQEGYDERMKRGLIDPPRYLPSSRVHLRLLEIEADPTPYFLPRPVKGNKDLLDAAPPGLSPDLASLFQFQSPAAQRRKRAEEAVQARDDDQHTDKRMRPDEDLSVEIGRRDSSMPASARGGSVALHGMDTFDLGDGGFNDLTGGYDAAGDGFQFEMEQEVPVMDEEDKARLALQKRRAGSRAASSRAGSVAPSLFGEEDTMARGAGLLAAFDDLSAPTGTKTPSVAQTPSQRSRVGQEDDDEEEASFASKPKGTWSKSAVTAIRVLNNELAPDAVPEGEMMQEKVLSFRKTATQASRRAAAGFFFELLVLGTRDCIKVEQKEPYSDISIAAKDRFWEVADSALAMPSSQPQSQNPSPMKVLAEAAAAAS